MLDTLASFFVAPADASRSAGARPRSRDRTAVATSVAVVGRPELAVPVGGAVRRMAGAAATVLVVDTPRTEEIDGQLARQDLVLVVLGADADPAVADLVSRDMPAGPRVEVCAVAAAQPALALARSGIVVGSLRACLRAALEGRR